MEFVAAYLQDVSRVLTRLPHAEIHRIIEILEQTRAAGRTVFAFGNGGSAATALHLVCDLVKGTKQEGGPPLRAISLTDNIATFSAYGNDFGYETVFADQLASLGSAGDAAIGISASGNSSNVLRAMEVAARMGMARIGFTGFAGGRLKDLVDACVVVPSEDMQMIEDAHLVVAHVLFRALIPSTWQMG